MVGTILNFITSGDVRQQARANFTLDTLAESLRDAGIDVPATGRGVVSADYAAHVHADASQREN